MPNGNLYIPFPEEQDNVDFGGQPHVGLAEGINDVITHDLNFGTTAQAIGFLHDKIEPGNRLTPDEYEKSQWKRPNINFSGGVSEARAKRSSERYDANLQYQEKLSGMNKGVLSGVGKFAGNAIGFTLDPINFAAISAAVATGGLASEPLLAAAFEYGAVATLGAKFASGALEAGLATVPSAATDFGAGKFYGENPSALAALSSLAINAGIGGLLHTAFGPKRVITKTDHATALRTAADQLETGKKVSVDEILKNGAYQQDILDSIPDVARPQDEIDQDNVLRVNSMIKDLEERKTKLSGIEGHDDVKKIVDDHLDFLKKKVAGEDIATDIPKLPESLKPEPLTKDQILKGDYDIDQLRGNVPTTVAAAHSAYNKVIDNVATLTLDDVNNGPVSPDELHNASKKLQSFQSDSTADRQEQLNFQRTIDDSKEDNFDALRAHVDSIKSELPDDIKDTVDNVDDIQNDHNTVAKAIRDYADCIIGQ